MKKLTMVVGSSFLGLIFIFFLAGRPISDLLGYFQAGASTTVKSIENEIPDTIHDEKTQAELAAARNQLVDRQVQLNLSQNQLKSLQHEISELVSTIDERGQVLAKAYPVLQNAVDGKESNITFVSTHFSLDEFQHEVDDLLSTQERDENALRIKQAGFERLKKSVADGEAALAAMKAEVLEIEQEFAILKTRRDQARMESDTLDLVDGAMSTGQSSTASIGKSINRLEGQVENLEARNAARRDVASVENRTKTSRLTKTFNRLEALKRYASEAESKTDPSLTENVPTQSEEVDSKEIEKTPYDAKEVVIRITGEEIDPVNEK
ncbi:MAG: hypothetical protein AAF939_21480 [Planctomycetota bacterium]